MRTQDIPVRLGDAFWAEDNAQLKGLTLKCGSKLDTIDASKDQLKLSLVKDDTGPEQRKFTLTSSKPGSRVFQGLEKPAKDVECILVYNSDSGGYELHPIGYDLRVLPTSSPPEIVSDTSRQSTPSASTLKSKRKPGAVRAAPSVMRNIRKPERKPAPSQSNTPRLDSVQSPSPPPITSATTQRKTPVKKAKPAPKKKELPPPVEVDDDLDDLANELEDVLEEEEVAQRTSSFDPTAVSSVSPAYDDGASSTSEEE